MMINKEIVIKSKLSLPQTITEIEKGMSVGFNLFPSQIMTGNIYGTKIYATINPPKYWSDPFRSRVEGDIESENGGTRLNLKVKFGLVNILVLLIWYFPMAIVLQHPKNQNIESILLIFGMCTIFSLLSLLLLRIKMNWDKRRLEDWLNRNLETKEGIDKN